ncbi:MAG: peptidyl-tRNA hydrolase, family [Desulfovibrionales bacterium]|jgi:PTH1 family peptidyl-tRNA hydrolase|nr:peptidyl-tRNA hydrolase, family [Desulfovibrionales bacterium]
MEYASLIACLGNPGDEYASTRHNFGFMLADAMLEQAAERKSMRLSAVAAGHDCQAWSIHFAGRPRLLVKPLTYMNLSGVVVARLSRTHHIPSADVLTVHDDMDLALGRVKLKRGGSAAGHNGVLSVQNELGASDFLRLRLGVGRPPEGEAPRVYVLEPFGSQELETVRIVVQRCLKGLQTFYRRGMSAAVQELHASPA